MPRKQRYCCDPYKRHKNKVYKNLDEASDDLIKLVNDCRLTTGDVLCLACQIMLTKDPRSLPASESMPAPENSATSSECDLISCGVESAAVASTGSSLSDAEIDREDTDRLMPVLGLSPLASTSK